MDGRLDPIVLGVGAADGYAGTDLTSPRAAVAAGEVPHRGTPDAEPVLELRIHGVGGAPPAENLESPATVQVAGDGTAGFFRAWYPGGSAAGRPLREAYCWGGLNTRASSRALYLLLVAFMLVNVAHWALPGGRSRADAVARGCLRLLGLALTVAFVATSVTVLGDLVAWQAAPRGGLPSWLGWYAGRAAGPRLATALLAVLAALALLAWLSVGSARAYERWGAGAYPDEDPAWPLTGRDFWRGERAVGRQRSCHVALGAAVVLLFAALPDSSADGLRWLLVSLAGLIALTAAVLVASPWADRQLVAGADRGWSDEVAGGFAAAAVGLAVLAAVSRYWWRIDVRSAALPGDQLLQVWSVVAQFALLAALLVLVLVRAPWRRGAEVMGFGLAAPLLAAVGCVIATIFGASLTLAVANVLGSPKVTVAGDGARGQTLLLPSTVYAGGLGMVAALLFVLATAGYLLAWQRWETRRLARTDADRPADAVLSDYPEPGGPAAVRCVARLWARSELTDHAATALTAVTLPTAVVLTGYLISLQAGGDTVALQRIAQVGGAIGVAATLYFLAVLRSALTDASRRRRFGMLWDVGTFWPRACHPFAPPCYAERSVPEVATRLRRLLGDAAHGHGDPAQGQQDAERRGAAGQVVVEPAGPVLLTGYSQGSPLAVAVAAQLPRQVRQRLALLTLAAPVRRLYGRTFPAYFGAEHLARLAGYFTGADHVRWRNLVRRSDYIGGRAFEVGVQPEWAAHVDRVLADPPVLWGDDDPSPPAAHLHSDYFQDPQVRGYALELAGQLQLGGGLHRTDVRTDALTDALTERLPGGGDPVRTHRGQ